MSRWFASKYYSYDAPPVALSLTLAALFALVDRLHTVLRAHAGGSGALFLTGAYASIHVAIHSERRRREGNGKKDRGQESY
jgi:hypothetical protein